MEKSKKVKLNQNILSFGVKVAKLPRRDIVADPLCEQKTPK
jgi:hypothetical protein